MKKNNVKLFAMSNSEKLGKKISKKLNIPLTKVNKTKFEDGEVILSSDETVRSQDTFIVASTSTPANETILELLIFIDSLKRASANSITIVLTYYGYARQDRKAAGRQPIGAKLIANLLETAGADKIISVDLHNPSIQGFFNIPVDDLRGQYILAQAIRKNGKFTAVSPDHGGASRARILADLISNSVEIAIVDKRRTGPNKSAVMGILGNVKGKNAVIIDDMIDTGGTIIKAAKAIKEAGAKKVIIAATHGIFSNGFDAFENAEYIDKVIVTDSIQKSYEIKSLKIEIISLDDLLSKTIKRTIDGNSVGMIYKNIREELKKN